MADDLLTLAREWERRRRETTHYDGCEADHAGCMIAQLADKVERLRLARTVDRHGLRQALETLREYEITPEYPLPTLIDGVIWVLEEHLKEETHD
jgi:hypothetical protein